nr:reverse transcriptase domain-containing protein [Tanacetum cinerariifolium]
VDFDADPRVPIILERSFLKTERALIDVYAGELTLRVNNEAVTFNLDQTSRYSANYNDMTANRIDVIDMACEEYSDFLLEEVDAFLALKDDPTSAEVNHSYYDTEGDTLLVEAFLNDDPSLPPPTQGMYVPQIRKELTIYEAKNDKSLIDEPPEVELKDLPPHLEYEFLEGDDKLPIIIAKDLSVEEKAALIKIGRALIDVYPVELTLRVNNEPVTFNLDQTSRYSANYNDMTANRIDVIDMACEEYSQEVLGFFDVIASGNLTPYYDPIVSTSSPTLTPFGDSDFLLEEVEAFLALEDDPTLPKVDHSYYDTEGDILFLEAFLNDDPSLPPPTKGMYLSQDLPPHLEYAFLEGDDKLPVIISKDLCVEEKAALIKVLKSHKQAIAWKLSDIKGINPEFYTHKILMEDDFELAV